MASSKSYDIIIIYSLLFLLILPIFASCSRCVQRSESVTGSMPSKGDVCNSISMDYIKEGFVSDGVYRIVIVEPKGVINCSSIEKVARRRMLVSLQKYVLSKNGVIDKNVNASFLNLIEEHGRMGSIIRQETRDVRIFEVRRSNLRQFVENLIERR